MPYRRQNKTNSFSHTNRQKLCTIIIKLSNITLMFSCARPRIFRSILMPILSERCDHTNTDKRQCNGMRCIVFKFVNIPFQILVIML